MRRFALLLFPLLFLNLQAETFYYEFTARTTEITNNEADYLGSIAPGDVLSGSLGITDEAQHQAGQYLSIFLELKTPSETIRVDHPSMLFLWWKEGHLELAWDKIGSIELPWSLRQFKIDLNGYEGSTNSAYLGQLQLEDFTSATLTLDGEHIESAAKFEVSFELESLDFKGAPQPQFFLDSGIQFMNIDSIRDLVLDKECIWIAGSNFYRRNGRQPLERLFLNGEPDNSFNIVGGFSNNDGSDPVIEQIERLPDGDLFVAGHFSHYMNIVVGNYARLNPDGSLDPDFAKNRRSLEALAGTNGPITAIQVLPDGCILLGGNFSTLDGLDRAHLAMVEATGPVVTNWSSSILVQSNYFKNIKSFAMTPSKQAVYVAGEFSEGFGNDHENLFRMGLASGDAEPLVYLNFMPAAFEQVALTHSGTLILREKSISGGEVYLQFDPESGSSEYVTLGENSELKIDRVDSLTIMQDDRIFAIGKFRGTGNQLEFTQAVFSETGDWLPEAFGQPLRIQPHEVYSLATDDGSIWIFGDFDLNLGTSDLPEPAWSHRPTNLARFYELTPPSVTDNFAILVGESEVSTQDGDTVYISLLRTGSTEQLNDTLDGHMEPVWSSNEHELIEYEDYVFAWGSQSQFEFAAYDRMVSVPISFLSNQLTHHVSNTTGTAVFAPVYQGGPISTSLANRTRIRIDVTNSTLDRLSALQAYFPNASSVSEAELDPDNDGRNSLIEILMRTDPRFGDRAPQPKLFQRLHPQDSKTVWMLEFPFNGQIEQANFSVFQSIQDLNSWQMIEENDSRLSTDRHQPMGERNSLMYGDPEDSSYIGLRINLEHNLSSAFWKVAYLAF